MSKLAKQIIEKINNDELDEIFYLFDNDWDILFNFLESKGVLNQIDPFKLEDNQNAVIKQMLDLPGSDKLYDKIISRLDDVEKVGDKYYLKVSDLSDLASLFVEYSRDTSPHDIALNVLKEDYWEPFWDTTYDVYSDVIEVLNKENLDVFKNKVLSELKDTKIELDGRSSEEMELIASEQGHDDYLMVTPENIDRIVDDSDSMNYLLDNHLDEIKSDLFSVHSNAYNDAYNSENYHKVWNELLQYFDDTKVEWTKSGNKYTPKLSINKSIKDIIYDYYSLYKNYGVSYTIEWKYLLNIIEDLMEQEESHSKLSFRISDYPDYREVEKNINSIFGDYF